MDIYKPSEEDLAPLLAEATANRTIDEWMDKYLNGLKTILLKNPLRYRPYGPYWWILKKVYIDRGDLSFGDYIDLEWFQGLDYGKAEMNILAAHAYEDVRTTTNFMDDPFHVMSSPDGGDSIEFASNDPEMEMMAAATAAA